jgi:hypothetical protein
MAQAFLNLTYRMIMMQRGIYLKCRQMANGRPVKRLQFHANQRRTLCNLSGAKCQRAVNA